MEDQSDESIIYLNIPRKVEINELELSDEQLEMVSGGTTGIFVALPYAGAFWGACAAAGTGIGTAIASYQNREDAAAAAVK